MSTRLLTLLPSTHAAEQPGNRAIWHSLASALLLMAALAIAPVTQAASSGGSADQPIVQQLLDSMAENDYQGFISQGTPAFAAVGEPQFMEVSQAVAPRLQQGYTVQYLGDLQQQGLDISVWKVSFADQGDDLLATLNVRDGRVGGFFLR